MTDRLQPPLNSALGKRKSDKDLGDVIAVERKSTKEVEVGRKKN